MEELAYDTLSEAKELKEAGFSGRQAEAIVGTVNRAMAINEQVARDLAAIKARIDNEMATRADLENFATKAELGRFATKDDLKNLATKDDLKNFATKDDLKNFATKADLADLRTEMVEGFGAIREDLKDAITGVYRSMMWALAGSFSLFATLITALRIWG